MLELLLLTLKKQQATISEKLQILKKHACSIGKATLTITGEVNDIPFEGSDTIRVIDE